jgi:hypothetical protein
MRRGAQITLFVALLIVVALAAWKSRTAHSPHSVVESPRHGIITAGESITNAIGTPGVLRERWSIAP